MLTFKLHIMNKIFPLLVFLFTLILLTNCTPRQKKWSISSPDKNLTIEDVYEIPACKDPVIEIAHIFLHGPQFSFPVRIKRGILDRKQPVIQMLGRYPVPAGIMHKLPGDIELPHCTPCPADHFRRQNILNAQFGHKARHDL